VDVPLLLFAKLPRGIVFSEMRYIVYVHQLEGTLPQAAKIPMFATSPEVVEWMHHCIPRDS
jgi:hypothetical protein